MTNILAYPFYNNSPKASRAESTDDQCSPDCSLQKIYKTNIIKYKTEICKNYSEMGYCPYRDKCQFAHGEYELHRTGPLPKKAYRTKKCKSFWEQGTCRYGFRCQFLHNNHQTHLDSDFIQRASLLLGSVQPIGKSKLSCIFEQEVS